MTPLTKDIILVGGELDGFVAQIPYYVKHYVVPVRPDNTFVTFQTYQQTGEYDGSFHELFTLKRHEGVTSI